MIEREYLAFTRQRSVVRDLKTVAEEPALATVVLALTGGQEMDVGRVPVNGRQNVGIEVLAREGRYLMQRIDLLLLLAMSISGGTAGAAMPRSG